MTTLTEHYHPSGDLERVFGERVALDENTAALFHISIERTKGNKIRVEVDATLDEDAIRRLVDVDKVRQLRLRRQLQQDELEAVPFDDGYRIKHRKALSVGDLNPRNKVLTKHGHSKDDGIDKKAAKGKDGGKGKENGKSNGKEKGRIQGYKSSAKSDSALARQRTSQEIELQKRQLPDFAKPFIKLRDIVPDPDWTRPAPPRFHGIHMHTKCFQRREKKPQWCEKVPVFQRYLTQAESLNGGALSRHVQHRSQLYDGMCQELMRLEDLHSAKPSVYTPRKSNCYDCQRLVSAAEGVFFKTSQADLQRNVMRAPQPPNSRKWF